MMHTPESLKQNKKLFIKIIINLNLLFFHITNQQLSFDA